MSGVSILSRKSGSYGLAAFGFEDVFIYGLSELKWELQKV